MVEQIGKFRAQFLAACRDPRVEKQQLLSTLEVALSNQPSLFDAHVADKYLDRPQHLWNAGFFEECMQEAARVFSLYRLKHLLQVRDELRASRVSGFAPGRKMEQAKSGGSGMSFQPTENLLENFQDGGKDRLQAQIALRLEIYDARNDADFLRRAADWATSRCPELFEPYMTSAFKKAISKSEADWNADYFDMQTEYLSGNFSRERYLHLIEVRQYLRDKGMAGFAALPRQEKPAAAQPGRSMPAAARFAPPAPSASHDAPPGTGSRSLRMALMVGAAIAALVVLVLSIAR